MGKDLAKTNNNISMIITKLIIIKKRWNLQLIDTHVPIVAHTYARFFFFPFSFVKSYRDNNLSFTLFLFLFSDTSVSEQETSVVNVKCLWLV